MISFSAQRCTSFFQTTAALFSGSVIFLLLTLTAQAQSSDELFRGTWQIDTPEKGALILIVKGQNRASYFWGDNTDRTVYQGTWTSDDETATLTWEDGSQHRIERQNLGFAITHLDAKKHNRYTAQAEQVPSEILGQWAKPAAKENETLSDRDKAEGFFGIWKIGDDESSPDYVFVEPDRSAATTAGDSPDGLRGAWAKQGSELHIAWDSGHYSILRPNKRTFRYKIVAPGQIIEEDETEMRPAARTIEENVPTAWLGNYQSERKAYAGGIAFSSRKNARNFYRGDWLIKRDEAHFERIHIARFGGLSTSTDRSLSGDWKMQGQDIFLRWDNGMRKILSPIGRGFVLYTYKPGRPLDGVPTRLRAATPADAAKLDEHIKGRADVAQQIIQLAEAAGIDPKTSKTASWGRTFSRWIWPFGSTPSDTSADALLKEEFAETRGADPWWWPFWSEKETSLADSSDKNDETESDKAELEEAESGKTEADKAKKAAVTEKTDATTTEEAPKPSPQGAAASETSEREHRKLSTESSSEKDSPQDPSEASSSSKKKIRSSPNWEWPF